MSSGVRKTRSPTDIQLRACRDEPLGAGNRRGHSRRQPVHALRQHEEEQSPVLHSCSAARDAIPLYEMFLAKLAADLGKPIPSGEFGADMQVALFNNGPVTILIDTKARA